MQGTNGNGSDAKSEPYMRAIQQPDRNQQSEDMFANSMTSGSSAAAGTSGPQTSSGTPSEMSPIDKWGLAGLFERAQSGNPDIAQFAIGSDLTSLGLDLASSEYAPHTCLISKGIC